MSSLLILEKNDQVPKTVINVKSEHMFLYHGVELLNQNQQLFLPMCRPDYTSNCHPIIHTHTYTQVYTIVLSIYVPPEYPGLVLYPHSVDNDLSTDATCQTLSCPEYNDDKNKHKNTNLPRQNRYHSKTYTKKTQNHDSNRPH